MRAIFLSSFFLVFLSLQAKADSSQKLKEFYNIFINECSIALVQLDQYANEKLGFPGTWKINESQDKTLLQVSKKKGRDYLFSYKLRVDGKRLANCHVGGSLKGASSTATISSFREWISSLPNLKIEGGQTSIWGDSSQVLGITGSWPQYNVIATLAVHEGSFQFDVSVIFED